MFSQFDDRPTPLISCEQVHGGNASIRGVDLKISPTFNTGQHTHIHLHLTIMDNGAGLIGKLKALLGRGKTTTAIVSPEQAIGLIESSMKEVMKDAKKTEPDTTDVPALSPDD